MPSVLTLRDYLESQQAITAYCANVYRCSHSARLRTEMLIQHLGWNFEPVRDRPILRYRLICSICGTRYPELIFGFVDARWSVPGAGTHDAGPGLSFEDSVKAALEFRRLHPEQPTVAKYAKRR